MTLETFVVLVVSTLGLVLIGYVILVPVLRALERPTLLLPWKRKATVAELQAIGASLMREPLSADEHLAVERALNTLAMGRSSDMTGPWSKSDPLIDAERDILATQAAVQRRKTEVEARTAPES